MRELPLGKADFADFLDGNFLYADKTKLLRNLLQGEMPYFLSRPRRFGKTLLVSTLLAILQGRRELFKGLWIDGPESDYKWEPTPVIHLSLNGVDSTSVNTLNEGLIEELQALASSEGLALHGTTPPNVFASLFNNLFVKYGQKIAVLIDEYDTPILDNLNNPKLADDIRIALRRFYNVLKAKSQERGFTFITGVTKFAQTSIFSTLNNLTDLTLNEKYASLCGFTLEEFDALFQDHLEMLTERFKSDGLFKSSDSAEALRRLVLEWYDGYSWDGKTRILNPWSILKLFQEESFADYWAQTGGVPTFIASLVKENSLDLNKLQDEETITDPLNVIELGDKLRPVPLMFQAGYLTVKRAEKTLGATKYFLGFPNFEVRAGMGSLLLSLKPIIDPLLAKKQSESAYYSLINRDAAGFQESFGSYLATYGYENHEPHEAFYRALFQSAMLLAGVKIYSQTQVGDGRHDIHLTAPDGTVFVMEVKYSPFEEVDKGKSKPANPTPLDLENMRDKAEEAMKQIDARNYAKPYRGGDDAIYKTALVVGGRTAVMIVFEKDKGEQNNPS